jgi:hypothetical protein
MIKNWSRYACALVLCLVVLFGSTGLTYFTHTCSSSLNKDVSLYPELFGRQDKCCCGDAVPANSAFDEKSGNTVIHQPDCCKVRYTYIKAVFPGFPQAFKLAFFPLVLVAQSHYHNLIINPGQEAFLPQNLLPDPSPPLNGRQLVQFLNQLKIPFPVS